MGEAALLELQLDLAEGGAAAAPVKCPLIQSQLDPRALRQAEQAAAAQELYAAERLKGAAAQVQDLPRRALGEECVEGAGQDLVLFDQAPGPAAPTRPAYGWLRRPAASSG